MVKIDKGATQLLECHTKTSFGIVDIAVLQIDAEDGLDFTPSHLALRTEYPVQDLLGILSLCRVGILEHPKEHPIVPEKVQCQYSAKSSDRVGLYPYALSIPFGNVSSLSSCFNLFNLVWLTKLSITTLAKRNMPKTVMSAK